MGTRSREANPSQAHRDSHTPTRSRELSPSRSQTRTVSSAHARTLPRTPRTPATAHSVTQLPHKLLSHSSSQTLSNTSSRAVSHSTHALWVPQSPGTRAREPPNSPFPFGATHATPKLFRFERRWDSSPPISGPGVRPLLVPRAAPPLTSHRQLQLAGLTACRASTDAATPAAAAAAAQRPAGRHPGVGRGAGPRSARQPLWPLSR